MAHNDRITPYITEGDHQNLQFAVGKGRFTTLQLQWGSLTGTVVHIGDVPSLTDNNAVYGFLVNGDAAQCLFFAVNDLDFVLVGTHRRRDVLTIALFPQRGLTKVDYTNDSLDGQIIDYDALAAQIKG